MRMPNLPQPAISDFTVFCKDLQQSVKKILPSSAAPFVEIACLGISFSNSDIPSVEPLKKELLDFFADSYHWKTEPYIIDASKDFQQCEIDLQKRVQSFCMKYGRVEEGKPLLVFYYSGHASQAPTEPKTLLIQ